MNAPKILPWIARKAGISDATALTLWRRAESEARTICGRSEGSDYHGRSIERFLDLVEARAGGTVRAPYSSGTAKVSWIWRHQGRMAMFGFAAAENAAKFWQDTWKSVFTPDHKFG